MNRCRSDCPASDCAGCVFPAHQAPILALLRIGHLSAGALHRRIAETTPAPHPSIESVYETLVHLEAEDLAHIAEPWARKWGAR